jgi:hypothetical protein
MAIVVSKPFLAKVFLGFAKIFFAAGEMAKDVFAIRHMSCF